MKMGDGVRFLDSKKQCIINKDWDCPAWIAEKVGVIVGIRDGIADIKWEKKDGESVVLPFSCNPFGLDSWED
jgi:hypothetical protein